jgi:hypothetical protein
MRNYRYLISVPDPQVLAGRGGDKAGHDASPTPQLSSFNKLRL